MAILTKNSTESVKLAVPVRPPLSNGLIEPLDQDPVVSDLPLALRNDEITESDFETLRRIAEDSTSPTGRLRRVPQSVPVVERKKLKS